MRSYLRICAYNSGATWTHMYLLN